MKEKRPLTTYEQMFGWPAVKRVLIVIAILTLIIVVIAAL